MKRLLLPLVLFTQAVPVHGVTTRKAPAAEPSPIFQPINDDCCICCEKLNTNLTTLSCNHGFHTNCIATWFANGLKRACPVCQAVQPETPSEQKAREKRKKDEQIAYDTEMARQAQTNWDNEVRRQAGTQAGNYDNDIRQIDEATRRVQQEQRRDLLRRQPQTPEKIRQQNLEQMKTIVVVTACVLILSWPFLSAGYKKLKDYFKKKSQTKKSPQKPLAQGT